ncbi:MAG: 50S ribosomal protein L31e [Candidatus Woesearchaeota archaeon]
MATNTIERTYTIPLRADFVKVPKYYRAKRAMSCIKKYIAKHMKTENVKLGNVLNEQVWARGIRNPPGKITVKAIKQGDLVTVELEGHQYKVHKVQTEKTDKPTSFKDKLAAKLKQDDKQENTTEETKEKEDVKVADAKDAVKETTKTKADDKTPKTKDDTDKKENKK